MEDVPFKPRAYEKASLAIESYDQPLEEVYRRGGVKALRAIPGIGASMADKLEELIKTGKCALREEYRARMPVDIATLTAIEGVGPKAVKVLYEQLAVRTVEDLEAAARAGKVRSLPHFGERSEQKILKALAFVQTSGARQPLAVTRPLIEEIARTLARVRGVEQVAIAGSVRRRKETIGDADLLAVARKPGAGMQAFVGLPQVIESDARRGDLQTQTDWTDGADSIEEMARAAKALGLEYVAITDHTRSLAMTRGSDEAKLRKQMAEIDRLNVRLEGIRVLKGAEVNINKDGTLDIDDETLAALDVVGVAVHSYFNLSRAEMTARIIRAMRNPHADILFHPTGRVIQKREPYDVDMDAIIAAARETGTVLEPDAYPERLDLKDEHVRKAVQAGVPIVIDSDAHSVKHLPFPRQYGVDQARRGWAPAADVLNSRPLDAFLAALKSGARQAATGSRNGRTRSRARSRRS